MATYDIGDIARLKVIFATPDGNAVDPSVIKFRVKNPNREITFYEYGVDAEILKDSTGTYHLDLFLDRPGTWYYRMEGLESNRGAGEKSLTVRESQFYNRKGILRN